MDRLIVDTGQAHSGHVDSREIRAQWSQLMRAIEVLIKLKLAAE